MHAVISGGPCSGTSSTAEALKPLGVLVVPEVAELVIRRGNSLPNDCHLTFQHTVFQEQQVLERQLRSLDGPKVSVRGLADAVAFRLIYGRELDDFHNQAVARSYDVVFLLDTLEHWENNGIRYEDLHFSREQNRVLRWVYERLVRVPVIGVPVATLDERVDFIRRIMTSMEKRTRLVTT